MKFLPNTNMIRQSEPSCLVFQLSKTMSDLHLSLHHTVLKNRALVLTFYTTENIMQTWGDFFSHSVKMNVPRGSD